MNIPTQTTTEPSNAFVRLLAEFRDGTSQAELSDKLQQLVAAVRETGKKGKLKYTVMVKPASTGNEALIVLDSIELDAPKLDRNGAIFFATDEGRLQRDNPNQMKLPLREVPQAPVLEVREAPAAIAG